MADNEKQIQRFEIRLSPNLKTEAYWASGRNDLSLGAWVKTLIVAGVRRERALQDRERTRRVRRRLTGRRTA